MTWVSPASDEIRLSNDHLLKGVVKTQSNDGTKPYNIIEIPAPASNDFWRSGASQNTLPDGTTDITETISRNGSVGIGTGVPLADLHIQRASNGATESIVENTNVTVSDYADTVILNGDVRAALGAYKSGGYGYTGTESNHDFFIYANNTTGFVMKPNGKVGIGIGVNVGSISDSLYVETGVSGDSGLRLVNLPSTISPTASEPIGVTTTGKVVRYDPTISPIVQTTTSLTLTDAHSTVMCANAAANIVITLPDTVPRQGKKYTIARASGSTGTITLQRSSTNAIQSLTVGTYGATTTLGTIGTYTGRCTMQALGQNWIFIG